MEQILSSPLNVFYDLGTENNERFCLATLKVLGVQKKYIFTGCQELHRYLVS